MSCITGSLRDEHHPRQLDRFARHLDTAAMRLIDERNAADYLREQQLLEPTEHVQVRELLGGVSNIVLYVSRSEDDDFVLKQAREQLRVAEPWFCSVERIWREVEVMRVCEQILQSTGDAPDILATTPRLLYADEDNYLYTMTAVASHETWKEQLLRGSVETTKALACGQLLGRLHAGSWQGQGLPDSLADRQFFEDLRIDPYYRQVARVHADLKSAFDDLVQSVFDHQQSLVHGDFSPKNLLVHPGGLVLVDFEVGHFGDPAFDLGFFLTHLFLKSFHARGDHDRYLTLVEQFWSSYAPQIQAVATDKQWASLRRRVVINLAGCMLARVDGKSQAEYLSDADRNLIREFARDLLLNPPGDLQSVVEQSRNTLDSQTRDS